MKIEYRGLKTVTSQPSLVGLPIQYHDVAIVDDNGKVVAFYGTS